LAEADAARPADAEFGVRELRFRGAGRLANDVRAEADFPRLVKFLLGDTGRPWTWEYGEMKFVE